MKRSILLIAPFIDASEASINESTTTIQYTVDSTTELTTRSTTESTTESSAAGTTRHSTLQPRTGPSLAEIMRGARPMLTTITTLSESPISADSTTTSSDPIESRITLIRTPDGKLFCNATTGIVSAPNVLMEITYGSVLIVSGSPSREDLSRLTFITSEGLSLPLDFPITAIVTGGGLSQFGIGRYSELLRLVGSVVIRKGHDDVEMVLRSSFESFANSCTPGTLLTVNRSGAVFQASYGLFGGTRVENVAIGAFLLSQSSGYIASVPALVFYRIQNLILQTGLGSSITRGTIDDRTVFSNCTRDVANQLPSINIGLRVGAGSFMLLPEDYMEFNDSRNECSMRIMDIDEPDRLLWFDPLRIDGMNVRFNSDGSFDICDSNDV